MTTFTPESLKALIERAGTNPSALAGMIGRGPDFVADFLKGRKKSFKATDAEIIDNKLRELIGEDTPPENIEEIPLDGLRVEGTANAGQFRDITLDLDDEHEREIVPVARDVRYPYAAQYALKVSGDSMDREFPNGSYVTCARWNDLGLDLKPGMAIHVDRVRAAVLVETTIKIFAVEGGRQWLFPNSNNTTHTPIEINGDEDTEIHIKGLVIGSWRPR